MSNTFQLDGSIAIAERRIHRRQNVLFSCAEFGENNAGIILNISQGGLALQALMEPGNDELPKMRFQLARMHSCIEATGRVVWRGDSNQTVGVEFIGLPQESREQIQNLISLTSHGGFESGSVRLRGKRKFSAAEKVASGLGKELRVIGLLLAAALWILTWFFLGHLLHKIAK